MPSVIIGQFWKEHSKVMCVITRGPSVPEVPVRCPSQSVAPHWSWTCSTRTSWSWIAVGTTLLWSVQRHAPHRPVHSGSGFKFSAQIQIFCTSFWFVSPAWIVCLISQRGFNLSQQALSTRFGGGLTSSYSYKMRLIGHMMMTHSALAAILFSIGS